MGMDVGTGGSYETSPTETPRKLTELPVFVSGVTFSRQWYGKANERSSTWMALFESFISWLGDLVNGAAGLIIRFLEWIKRVVFARYIPSALWALFESLLVFVFQIKFVRLLAETYINLYCFAENKLEKFFPPSNEADEMPCETPSSTPFYKHFVWALRSTARIPTRIFFHLLICFLAWFYTLVWAVRNDEKWFGTNASSKFNVTVNRLRARDRKKGLVRRVFTTMVEVALGTLRFFLGREVPVPLGDNFDDNEGPVVQSTSTHED